MPCNRKDSLHQPGIYLAAMDTNALQEFRILIESTLAELRSQLPYLDEETKPISPSCSLGRLTRMEALNDKGVNEHVLRETEKRIERLDNAMKRIDAGNYGLCIRCNKPIPVERLKIVPEALICVPCGEKPRR
jgi:DnaK suppressor protein